jgi:1-hydroxycarotenoid 3,4-desaturase
MRCVVREERFKLDRHNVFFENNYANEFKDIFIDKKLPTTPTVYICAQERGVEKVNKSNGSGHELSDSRINHNEPLFCLVNAPPTGDTHTLTKQELDACEKATFSLIQRCGLQLEVDPTRTIQTLPQQFHQAFPATGGALYGQATHGWMQVFSRSQAKTQIKGLFLTGGSVHPGPGVPMAAMSGRLAGAAAMEHLGLIKR